MNKKVTDDQLEQVSGGHGHLFVEGIEKIIGSADPTPRPRKPHRIFENADNDNPLLPPSDPSPVR